MELQLSEPNLNLCEEVILEMKKLGFEQNYIDFISNSSNFKQSYNENVKIQRSMLTILFYRILISGNIIAPDNIRVALNIATDINSWLDDIKLVILPWLYTNREYFFK